MTEREIKQTWRNLITPFIVYVVLCIVAICFNRFGSKQPTPQTVSFFASAFCFTFIVFYAVKMINFKKFLKGSSSK